MASKKSITRRLSYVLLLINLLAIIAATIYFRKSIVKYSLRAYSWYVHQKSIPPSPFHFPDYEIHGIDISHFQPVIDWHNLQALSSNGDTITFRFVFIKATEGSWWDDELFAEHWDNARKNGIIRGAYHYFHPNRNPELQAENFIESVHLEAGDLPPVIDIEDAQGLEKREVVTAIKRYAKVIEQKYNVKPILYSNRYFIEDYLLDDFTGYTFWIANYYRTEMDAAIPWQFWQHTDKATLLYTGTKIDANVFRGTESDLQKLLIKTQ